MRRKMFTEEQVEILATNPYTYRVSKTNICFTTEFKEFFWNERCNGMTAPDIFIKAGYDVDMIGSDRIRGFRNSVNKTKKNGEDFVNGRRTKRPITDKESEDNSSDVKALRAELDYLKKEVEFLKKISSAANIKK